MRSVLRTLPLALLILCCVGTVSWWLSSGVSPETLFLTHYPKLQLLTQEHAVLAALAYTLAYLLLVVFGIPGGLVMSLAGGFLFGAYLGCLLSITGATLGAMIIWGILRLSVGDRFEHPQSGLYAKIHKGFMRSPVLYLLLMRSTPFFPFMAVNIVAAGVGIRFRTYVWTTFFGLIPEALVFTSLGSELETQLAQGHLPGMEVLLNPAIYLPILLLVLLACVMKLPLLNPQAKLLEPKP